MLIQYEVEHSEYKRIFKSDFKKAVLLKASQAGKYLTRYHKLRLLQNAGIIKKLHNLEQIIIDAIFPKTVHTNNKMTMFI